MLDVRSAFSLVRRGFLCRWLFLSYVLRASASCSSCRIGYAMIDKLAPRQYQGVMMGNWMLVTGLASLFAGDFSGMIPEPTGTTAVVTNPGYAKLAQTRARRIKNACSMLAAGKRRVCCFDRSGFYSKSLSAPKSGGLDDY